MLGRAVLFAAAALEATGSLGLRLESGSRSLRLTLRHVAHVSPKGLPSASIVLHWQGDAARGFAKRKAHVRPVHVVFWYVLKLA